MVSQVYRELPVEREAGSTHPVAEIKEECEATLEAQGVEVLAPDHPLLLFTFDVHELESRIDGCQHDFDIAAQVT